MVVSHSEIGLSRSRHNPKKDKDDMRYFGIVIALLALACATSKTPPVEERCPPQCLDIKCHYTVVPKAGDYIETCNMVCRDTEECKGP